MDWATFFKDYGQSLFTLGGVFLGSLITFLINYLNLRNQSKERDKDREEQKREAKIQAREKWIERDILTIMDSVDRILKYLSESSDFSTYFTELTNGKKAGIFSENEYLERKKSLFDSLSNRYTEVHQVNNLINKLVFSFSEQEIELRWARFAKSAAAVLDKHTEYMENQLNEEPVGESGVDDTWLQTAAVDAGKLHQALRTKLISLRDI